MKKKIIAVLLSACMLVSACPTGAFAMSDEETNTYTATGDVMQGGTPVVDETPAPEETEAPEQTPTPAPVETPTPVEVEAQATPAAGAEETAPAKQSEEAGISTAMLLPDDEKPKVDTYRFYDADGKELTDWTQTVAKGDELLEPPAPTKENARFVGWYVGKTPLSFGEVAAVSGTEVTVTAKFEVYSYVYFMNEDGTKVVYYTAAGVAGENVAEADLNAATAKVELTMGKEKGVVGWSTTQDSNTPDASITFVAGDTYVYPVVKTGFWVTFNTDGGDYVAPQFRMEPLDLSTVTPNRSGYTFDGWYIGGQKVTSVSAEATVTAHWEANSETEYTVIHWQENADDDGYSSKDIEKKTGATNSTTNAKAKSYSGFTAQTIEQKTIAGDGSTIVNVYYKRNVYIVNFYDRKGKKEYTDLRISAKYGANISKKWPTYNGSNTWYVGKNSNTSQVNIDTMPLGGAKFYGPKTGYGSETAYYYVEVLPGESGTTTYNGVQYKLHHSDTSPGTGYTVSKEDQYPITGFTFNANVSTPIRGKYNNAKFYYTRNSYNIVFMNKGAKDSEVSRKYQQNISDVNYNPTKPAGVPANFTFAGWYDNEPCGGTAYDFTGKTVPAQNITLYAKWQAPQVNATVYLSASADGESVTIEIPYGTKLSDSEDFKALLEKFKEEQPSAWIDSNGALFNVDTELYSSVTISPFFPSAKDGFTVTYVEGENENVATDNQKYVSGSSARVLPPENSENFRAWKTEDGKLIHPGDKITVTKDTILTAVYTIKPQTETITYHYNFGGSADTRTDDNGGKGYPRNTTATVKSLGEVNFAAPTGYKFLGWATTPDSNTIEYVEDDPVFVDANGDNDLYAVWQVKTYTVTWVNWDGTVLETDTDVEYNSDPRYDGKNPTRAADAQYTYTFKSWDKPLEKVTKDVTYTAVYEETINKYTIKWVDWDGSEVRTDTEVPYGTELEVPEDPTRAADDQYTYTFKGWTPEVETVTGDAVYTAVYEKTTNKYTVTWKNDDGSVLRTDKNVEYGTMPNYGSNPTKAADAQYTYTFKGWTPEVKTVTGDATYKATYTKEANTYTLTYDLDGGEWENDTTYTYTKKYKEEVEVKADPTKTGYTFAGWTSAEVEVVNGKFTMPAKDVTLKAKWNVNKYTIKWVNWDDSEVRTDTEVAYGTELEVPEDPTRAADAEYTYTFAGWTPKIETVTGDATYKATYTKEANTYTLTYDLDGGEWENDTTYTYPKKYNEEVEVKADPTKEGYTFAGWMSAEVEVVNGKFTMPAKDVTLKAKWEANVYKVTYDLDGGEWTEATNEFPYEYKATVEVVKTVPTREGYKFSGWRSEEVTIENDAFTMPAKDVVLKAVWEANPTPTPIPSEEPTPTPAPTEEPTPTPAPTEEPTPTPAPTEEPTPTPAPTEEPTPTPAPTEEPTPTPAPNPNPNPNPATPTPMPVAPVVPATVATPTPTPTATPSATPSDNGGKGDGNNDGEIGETINDNETPLANGEDIADNATPLAGLGTGAWALINLILTIVTTLLSILLLIGYIGKKKKALEDEDGNVVLDENGKEVMEYEKNKKGLWRLISIIPALIAIIVFIFTEDMTLPMIFIDKWTILHVVIALVQVVVMVLCKKKKDENDEDENAANA